MLNTQHAQHVSLYYLISIVKGGKSFVTSVSASNAVGNCLLGEEEEEEEEMKMRHSDTTFDSMTIERRDLFVYPNGTNG